MRALLLYCPADSKDFSTTTLSLMDFPAAHFQTTAFYSAPQALVLQR
jgi:hypothetical protein